MSRPEFNQPHAVQAGQLLIDFDSHLVKCPDGRIISMTQQEINMLVALSGGEGLTREELGKRLGAYSALDSDQPFTPTPESIKTHARSSIHVSVVLHNLTEKLGDGVITRHLQRGDGGAIYWLNLR